MTCPMARPISQDVSVNWIIDGVVEKSSVIWGNAGKYISVASGPNEQIEAKSVIKILFFIFANISICFWHCRHVYTPFYKNITTGLYNIAKKISKVKGLYLKIFFIHLRLSIKWMITSIIIK